MLKGHQDVQRKIDSSAPNPLYKANKGDKSAADSSYANKKSHKTEKYCNSRIFISGAYGDKAANSCYHERTQREQCPHPPFKITRTENNSTTPGKIWKNRAANNL